MCYVVGPVLEFKVETALVIPEPFGSKGTCKETFSNGSQLRYYSKEFKELMSYFIFNI